MTELPPSRERFSACVQAGRSLPLSVPISPLRRCNFHPSEPAETSVARMPASQTTSLRLRKQPDSRALVDHDLRARRQNQRASAPILLSAPVWRISVPRRLLPKPHCSVSIDACQRNRSQPGGLPDRSRGQRPRNRVPPMERTPRWVSGSPLFNQITLFSVGSQVALGNAPRSEAHFRTRGLSLAGGVFRSRASNSARSFDFLSSIFNFP